MPRVKGDKYSRKYAKQLKNGLRADGKSIPEVCQQWAISKTTYYYWVENHPEFKDAHDHGNRDCAAWWHILARKAASGEVKANAGIICFAMKNVDDVNWADKVSVETKTDETIRQINISILPPPDQKQSLPNPKVIDVDPEDG